MGLQRLRGALCCASAISLLVFNVTLAHAAENAAAAQPVFAALTSVDSVDEAESSALKGNADNNDAQTRVDEPKDDKGPTPLERARSALAQSTAPALSEGEVCTELVDVARENALPVGFFTNLIWRESKFDHEAISRAGAMGIAQFMPDVADKLKLDAFDARDALSASGRLLRELFSRFNNLGLVAAAYNAGPKRVLDWMRQKSTLPKETRDYVSIITGRSVDKWVGPKKAVVFNVPRQVPCHRSTDFAAVADAERAAQLQKVAEEEKAERLEKERKEREAAAARAAAAKNAKNKGKHTIATASRAKPASHSVSHAAAANGAVKPVSLRNTDKRLFIKRNLRSA